MWDMYAGKFCYILILVGGLIARKMFYTLEMLLFETTYQTYITGFLLNLLIVYR